MTELVYVHDFDIMSGFIVLAYLAILNGNFWAAVQTGETLEYRVHRCMHVSFACSGAIHPYMPIILDWTIHTNLTSDA